MRLKGKK